MGIKFSQSMRMAMKALRTNRMRSFLTMLGIIIGVFAVTVLISIGQGASQEVNKIVSGLGSNMLMGIIYVPRSPGLTPEALEEMRGTFGISLTAPSVTSDMTLKNGTKTMLAKVEGTTPEYSVIRSHYVTKGRFLKPADLETRTAVAVVGIEIAEELYGSRDVVGQPLNIAGRDFEIIGLLEPMGSSTFGDDKRVIIPYTLAQRMLSQTTVTSFYASTDSAEDVYTAQAALERLLFRITKDNSMYDVFNQAAVLGAVDDITSIMTIVLGSLAGISLLVGGIGIMNIMLVSVSERTREIGIRKAVGAQRNDILAQFLIESLVISLMGGLVGLVLGSITVVVIAHMMETSNWLSPMVALLAVAFSMAVGIGFGVYPANKASKLKPIDALRYE